MNGPWSLYGARERWAFMALLLFVSTLNVVDRVIISVLLEPIKNEFRLSDTMLGFLSGFGFALCYATAGLPFARWADRGDRSTVIALALGVWSAMTVLCGFAQAWWQLVLARMGVGIAESGSQPPTQSLIADYFPPDGRALAIACLNATGNIGYLIGIALGGYIAAHHGWRAAFVLVGAPGVLLALLIRWLLPEPRLRLGWQRATIMAEPLRGTIRQLTGKRSFRSALVAISLYSFFGYAIAMFLPGFMQRSLHASLAEVSVTFGVTMFASSALGALSGGVIADRLGARDIRWLAWLPAAACTLAVPLYALAFAANQLWMFLACCGLAEALLAAGFPAAYAAIHAVCGSARRATAFAIMFLTTTLFGLGLGPLCLGAMSDALGDAFGAESLRYAMSAMLLALLPAAASFYGLGRFIPRERED
jgi:MFS family permease